MAWRNSFFRGDPLGFQYPVFGEAHENWVKRAGFKPGFAAEFIAVMPSRRAFGEMFKDA